MKILEQEAPVHIQEEKPSHVWAIGAEYPHILTKHKRAYESDDLLFFDTMEEAFVSRRNMSPEYMETYLSYKEYDDFHRTETTVTSV